VPVVGAISNFPTGGSGPDLQASNTAVVDPRVYAVGVELMVWVIAAPTGVVPSNVRYTFTEEAVPDKVRVMVP